MSNPSDVIGFTGHWEKWDGDGEYPDEEQFFVFSPQRTPPTSITQTTNKKPTSFSFAGIKNGQINLRLQAGNYTAELYNLQGRLIGSADISATNGINATGLRADNLSRGVFILNVKQAGNSVLRHKISVR